VTGCILKNVFGTIARMQLATKNRAVFREDSEGSRFWESKSTFRNNPNVRSTHAGSMSWRFAAGQIGAEDNFREGNCPCTIMPLGQC
jgi:hypothetical protein